MFCYHCGAKLEAGTQFCPRCGAAVQAGQPAGQPSPGAVCSRCGARLEPGSLFCDQCGTMTNEGAVPSQPPPGGRGRRAAPSAGPGRRGGKLSKKVVALIAAGAVLAVSALAMVAVPLVIQMVNPRAYLTACASNTLARLSSASQATADTLGVAKILEEVSDGRVEQRLTVGLGEVPHWLAGYSARQLLSGAGLTMVSQSDLENRQMALDYTLALGGMDLGSITLALDDDLIAVGSRELSDGVFYGFHSQTMGADFNANPALQGLVDPSASFNLFDLIERWREEKLVLTDATLAQMAQLNADLVSAMAVERDGDTVTAVLSPASAQAWVRGMYDAVAADENVHSYFGLILEESGTTLDELLDELSYQMDELLEYIQEDVRLTCTIRDGSIAQAQMETVVDGVAVALRLTLGTGDHPMDDFSLQWDMEQQESGQSMSVLWSSQGNHSAQGGIYVDESQIEVLENGTSLGTVSWSTHWEPGGDGDNFTWTLSAWDGSAQREAFAINVSGTVTVDGRAGSLEADLNDVSLIADGETLSLSLLYSIAPCDTLSLMPEESQVVLVPDMSQSEMEEVIWQLQYNAMELGSRIEESLW